MIFFIHICVSRLWFILLKLKLVRRFTANRERAQNNLLRVTALVYNIIFTLCDQFLSIRNISTQLFSEIVYCLVACTCTALISSSCFFFHRHSVILRQQRPTVWTQILQLSYNLSVFSHHWGIWGEWKCYASLALQPILLA